MKKLFQILAQQQLGKIYFYDVIGYDGSRAIDVARALDKFDEEGVEQIEVHINSPGGVVYEAFAIYNLLKDRADKVTVFIDGLAASAASYIAMASPQIRIYKNSKIMIHNPWTLAYGDEEDLKKMRENLQDIKRSLVEAYSRSGKSEQEISEMMDEETWLNAEQAIEEGFADEIIDKEVVKVEDVINQYFPKEDPMREHLIKLLGLNNEATDEEIQAKLDELMEAATRQPEPDPEPDPDPVPADSPAIAQLQKKLNAVTQQVTNLVRANEKLAEDLQREKAESLVAQAIAAGKIFPSQKETYIKEAVADLAAFTAKLEKMPKLFDPEKKLNLETGDPEPQTEYAKAVAYLRQRMESAA